MDALGAHHCDEQGWPLYTNAELRKFNKQRAAALREVMAKLRAGEWVAKAICLQFGTEPRDIEPDLWTYLNLDDRIDEAYGEGLRFLAVTVSSQEPRCARVSHRQKAELRVALTNWLRARDAKAKVREKIELQLAAARAAFAPVEITRSMYRHCRRVAGLQNIVRGRPPKEA